MKPHPRIRKTVKWGGLALTVVLGVAWIGSTRWFICYFTGSYRYVELTRGRLEVGSVELAVKSDPIFASYASVSGLTGGWDHRPDLRWDFQRDYHPTDPGFALPLWVPALVTALATARAWRLDSLHRRLAMAGVCPRCRYDRSGLAAGAVCPECGAGAPGGAAQQ